MLEILLYSKFSPLTVTSGPIALEFPLVFIISSFFKYKILSEIMGNLKVDRLTYDDLGDYLVKRMEGSFKCTSIKLS